MENSQKTVCVAGASGLVGSNIVKTCLDHGYRVHGTMRDAHDATKTPYLTALPGADERLRLFDADMAHEDSFDAALAGTDCVFIACLIPTYEGPGGTPATEMDEAQGRAKIIQPTVDGCLNIMRAAVRQGVRNVVICSSTSSTNPQPPVPVKNETEHWSDADQQCRDNKYTSAAKTVMETQAMAFAEAHGIRLSILLPTLMLGPAIIPQHLEKGFLGDLKSMVEGSQGRHEQVPAGSISMIHLQDVAALFLAAYEHPDASGRYFAVYDSWTWKDIYGELANLLPQAPMPTPLDGESEPPTRFDFTRRDSLGVDLRDIPAILRDTVEWIRSDPFSG